MMSFFRSANRRRDERGQSLVEFALLLPFLLILLMGIFEIGRAWQRSQVLTDICREAARVAAVASSNFSMQPDTIDDIITAGLLAAGLNPAEATVSYPPDAPGAGYGNIQGGYGQPVTVRIEYPHPIAILDALLGTFRGNDPDAPYGPIIVLKTQVSFRNE